MSLIAVLLRRSCTFFWETWYIGPIKMTLMSPFAMNLSEPVHFAILGGIYRIFHITLLSLSQRPGAGRGFNELHQEVRQCQGGWGHSLDHPPCSDKSQNSGFLKKSIFLILESL